MNEILGLDDVEVDCESVVLYEKVMDCLVVVWVGGVECFEFIC